MRKKRSLVRDIMPYLPVKLRHGLIRRRVEVGSELENNLSFRVARTQQELECCYRILQDSYLEYGFAMPSESNMRITKYFAMPTTTTLLVEYNGEIVGTMSLIRKSPLGLPLEQVFQIKDIIKPGEHVCEISSLAIASPYRHRRGMIFLPFCRYMYFYIRNCMKIDKAVIAVNPSWKDLYQALFGFHELEKKVVDTYDFANGAPAVGLYLDVHRTLQFFEKNFDHRPDKNNLKRYFVENYLETDRCPRRDDFLVADPVMSPENFEYFFVKKSNIFYELSESEKFAVIKSYPVARYEDLWKKFGENEVKERSPRYVAKLHARVAETGQEVQIIDVSRGGVKILSQGNLPDLLTLSIPTSKYSSVTVQAKVEWRDPSEGYFGYRILQDTLGWFNYIRRIEKSYEVISIPSVNASGLTIEESKQNAS